MALPPLHDLQILALPNIGLRLTTGQQAQAVGGQADGWVRGLVAHDSAGSLAHMRMVV